MAEHDLSGSVPQEDSRPSAVERPELTRPVDGTPAELRETQARGASEKLPRWEWGRIADFYSRTRRGEFLAAVAIAYGSQVVVYGAQVLRTEPNYPAAVVFGTAFFIWWFWGASINRLHDIGKSGWTCGLYLIPLVGFGLLIWLAIQPGDSGRNRWGPPVA